MSSVVDGALEAVSEVTAKPIAAIGKIAGEVGTVAQAAGEIGQAVSETAPSLHNATEGIGAKPGGGLSVLDLGAAEPNFSLIAHTAPTSYDALKAFAEPITPPNEVASSSPNPDMDNVVINGMGLPSEENQQDEQDLQLGEDIQALTALAPSEVLPRVQEIDGFDLSDWSRHDPLGVAEIIQLWHEHNPDMANPVWNGSLQSFLNAHFEEDNKMMEANVRAMGMNPDESQQTSDEQLEKIKREALLRSQMKKWRENVLHDRRFDDNQQARQDVLASIERIEATLITKERMKSIEKRLLLKIATLARSIGGIAVNKYVEQAPQSTSITPSTS